jgi:hypothetical protein
VTVPEFMLLLVLTLVDVLVLTLLLLLVLVLFTVDVLVDVVLLLLVLVLLTVLVEVDVLVVFTLVVSCPHVSTVYQDIKTTNKIFKRWLNLMIMALFLVVCLALDILFKAAVQRFSILGLCCHTYDLRESVIFLMQIMFEYELFKVIETAGLPPDWPVMPYCSLVQLQFATNTFSQSECGIGSGVPQFEIGFSCGIMHKSDIV